MTANEISYKIISKVIEIHKTVGPGLLESTYEQALMYELQQNGLKSRKSESNAFYLQKGQTRNRLQTRFISRR
ncbi:GxxExxY protein [Marinifilum sp. RC60d5]|uniref:GxxExxY protein n=1 Tax=Marinifilum sp. RC60d5 TaxID=3458414 RepID=UPI00403672D9